MSKFAKLYYAALQHCSGEKFRTDINDLAARKDPQFVAINPIADRADLANKYNQLGGADLENGGQQAQRFLYAKILSEALVFYDHISSGDGVLNASRDIKEHLGEFFRENPHDEDQIKAARKSVWQDFKLKKQTDFGAFKDAVKEASQAPQEVQSYSPVSYTSRDPAANDRALALDEPA